MDAWLIGLLAAVSVLSVVTAVRHWKLEGRHIGFVASMDDALIQLETSVYDAVAAARRDHQEALAAHNQQTAAAMDGLRMMAATGLTASHGRDEQLDSRICAAERAALTIDDVLAVLERVHSAGNVRPLEANEAPQVHVHELAFKRTLKV